MYRLRSKILFSISLIVSVVAIGTIGYQWIENYSWLQALYMTIITISTVGYGEVQTLSDEGRIFTIILIISNIGIFAYSISSISSYFLDGYFFKNYRLNKMKQRIAKLNHHVVVCGFGRNGKEACHTLKRHRIPFVVIEKEEGAFDDQDLGDALHYLIDDSTHENVLLEAGVERARALVTTLPGDAENVFVVLTARELNKNMLIISRASLDTSVSKLRRAGANNIIMPDKIGGAHMASLVINPDVKEFIDLVTGQSGSSIHIEEMSLRDLSHFHGSTIRELNIRHTTGVNVVGLKREDGSYVINPEVDTPLLEGMKLILLGTEEQMKRLRQMA
jgi:voltage-gated potassium channel